jgi:hypothetical protein
MKLMKIYEKAKRRRAGEERRKTVEGMNMIKVHMHVWNCHSETPHFE